MSLVTSTSTTLTTEVVDDEAASRAPERVAFPQGANVAQAFGHDAAGMGEISMPIPAREFSKGTVDDKRTKTKAPSHTETQCCRRRCAGCCRSGRRTAHRRRSCSNRRRATHGRSKARQARVDWFRPNMDCPADTSGLHRSEE